MTTDVVQKPTIDPESRPNASISWRTRCIQLLMVLISALFFAIMMEWAGMYFDLFDQNGVAHSQAMFNTEINYLNDDFTHSLLQSHPVIFVRQVSDWSFHWLFEYTGIVDGLQWLKATPSQFDSKSRLFIHELYLPLEAYALAGIVTVQTFFVRLSILILASPAYFLFGMVGLANGLAERDIRRWSGGRETAYQYHMAKRALPKLFFGGCLLYLSMPFSIHPNAVILPFSIAVGFALNIMMSKFKKYL